VRKGKIKALLCDLDDTLLINDMEDFLPHYYRALVAKIEPLCPPGRFMDALNQGTKAMWRNDGLNGTNAEVFAAEFYPRLPCEREEMEAMLMAFYAEEFEDLKEHTQDDPMAYALVQEALRQEFQIAVVTQPIFPLDATLARLRWAGVGVDEIPYDLISSFETMRACKPHPAFFRAVLEALGRVPEECLMVGDSSSADMAAGKLGIKTFWVDRGRGSSLIPVPCDAQGDLDDLIQLIRTGAIDEL